MGMDAWTTVGVVVLVMAMLVKSRISPDILLLGGLTLLLVLPTRDAAGVWRMGIIEPAEAFSGLSNPGPITVGVLYIVVAGMRETGSVSWIVRRLLGRPKSLIGAQLRVMSPVVLLSAFLNNTPVVAMMIPAVRDWGKRLNISPSQLMIPLSYAAIFGGVCTLIGTSTNLVVSGLLEAEPGRQGLKMFDIAWVGVPCAAAGMIYLIVIGRRLLPKRESAIDAMADPREYTIEMIVNPTCPLVGKTIEQAGLRHLPGMYLMEIDRDDHVLAAVSPEVRIQAHDRLVFVGIVDSVKDLQKIRGLEPATDQVFKLESPRESRCLIEAVVSNTCPIVGKTIRDGRFRNRYDAAVIAVARNGERINKKIGDIVLRPGDTLLLETQPTFARAQQNRRDFFLVSEVADSAPLRFNKSWISLLILASMVASVTLGWLDMLTAAMLAAGLMLITRCCSGAVARRSVDWSLLMVIAAAFGIGRALDSTGAAKAIAESLISIAGDNPWIALAMVYLVTTIFTELITNNAAAVLVFPIALATADKMDVNFMPFVISIMIGASASYSTPLGYQTNLMVFGPGGYRVSDYLKVGIPLNVVTGAVTVLLAPRIWPF
jgi:di/tricarboxylate transporter